MKKEDEKEKTQQRKRGGGGGERIGREEDLCQVGLLLTQVERSKHIRLGDSNLTTCLQIVSDIRLRGEREER